MNSRRTPRPGFTCPWKPMENIAMCALLFITLFFLQSGAKRYTCFWGGNKQGYEKGWGFGFHRTGKSKSSHMLVPLRRLSSSRQGVKWNFPSMDLMSSTGDYVNGGRAITWGPVPVRTETRSSADAHRYFST